MTSASKIKITYEAHLNKFVQPGRSSNTNDVELKFSNDPYANKHGKIKTNNPNSLAKTYTFGLNIAKYDGSEGGSVSLPGVEFELKNSGGKYAKFEHISGDGYNAAIEWVDTESNATKVKTDSSGHIKIKGLTDVSYILHESSALEGYDTMRDVPFSLKGVLTKEGDLTSATPTLTENRSDASVSDSDNDGIIEISLTNYKSAIMPHTGGAGTTALYIISATVGIAGIIGLILVFRKRGRNDKNK